MNVIASRRPVVSVIGASKPSARVYQVAEEVGREVASRGYVLACGGLGGVMEAACRGAKQAGGTTLGILPVPDKSAANRYVDIVVPTNLHYARNVLVVLAGDAVVAVGGAAGTLSEMAYAWVYDKPIVALNAEGMDGWSVALAGKRIDETRPDAVLSANSAREALDLVAKFVPPPQRA
ncbi:MAG: hypothetical protein Kow0069_04620 [Promethearchaeota archaeon]